jgi:hypothetical protein
MFITRHRLAAVSMLIAPLKMVPPTASAKPASICAESPVIGPDGGSEQTAWRSSQMRRCLDMTRKPSILGAVQAKPGIHFSQECVRILTPPRQDSEISLKSFR